MSSSPFNITSHDESEMTFGLPFRNNVDTAIMDRKKNSETDTLKSKYAIGP